MVYLQKWVPLFVDERRFISATIRL
jgi:hypothetical protein